MTTLVALSPYGTVVVAILVLFLGKYLTSRVAFLRDYNIPEPVSGGLIASILFGVAYGVFGLEFIFALDLRDGPDLAPRWPARSWRAIRCWGPILKLY